MRDIEEDLQEDPGCIRHTAAEEDTLAEGSRHSYISQEEVNPDVSGCQLFVVALYGHHRLNSELALCGSRQRMCTSVGDIEGPGCNSPGLPS